MSAHTTRTPASSKKPKAPKVRPTFWLVWRDGGFNSTPHHKHAYENEARAEAERLAKQHPAQRFYVLPATEYAVVDLNPVAWRRDESALGFNDDEPPF